MTLFHQTIQAAGAVTAAVANRVDLGDITLPAGNWTITRAWASSSHVGTITDEMTIAGYIQLESSDCGIAPFNFFIEPEMGPLGTGEVNGPQLPAKKYIINCPAPGGAVINVYHVSDTTITTVLSETIVTIEFARGSPFPGGQIHQKCGEPSTSGSVSDGGTSSFTDIEIKASKLHAVMTYATSAVPIASTSIHLMFEMKSDDFAESGPHKWAMNVAAAGGVATNFSGQLTPLQIVEVDAAFRSPGQKQTVTAVSTAYDALSTGPVQNWCLIYT